MPITFDSIRLPVAVDPSIRMPAPRAKLLMSRPRIVVPGPSIERPSASPAAPPASSISGVPAYPGWVKPSIRTGAVIAGSGVLGAMVSTPWPGMSKSIASPARSRRWSRESPGAASQGRHHPCWSPRRSTARSDLPSVRRAAGAGSSSRPTAPGSELRRRRRGSRSQDPTAFVLRKKGELIVDRRALVSALWFKRLTRSARLKIRLAINRLWVAPSAPAC